MAHFIHKILRDYEGDISFGTFWNFYFIPSGESLKLEVGYQIIYLPCP